MSVTKIEWVRNPDGTPGHTVNPIRFRNKETGKVGHYCEKISAGCKNCYASAMQKPYLSGLEFNAENRGKGELFFDDAVLESVLRRGKPTSYFWADCTDLFGRWVPDEWIDKCFATCALTPQHRHMFLTKRAERMRGWFSEWRKPDDSGGGFEPRWCAVSDAEYAMAGKRVTNGWPLPNVWLGVSCEDQKTADERIPLLLQTPAAARFISLEPMLGPVTFRWAKWAPIKPHPATNGHLDGLRGIDLVIVGGESGPSARPCRIKDIETVRDECAESKTAFFLKQLGAYPIWAGAKSSPVSHGLGKNVNMAEWPESLRVREFPARRESAKEER